MLALAALNTPADGKSQRIAGETVTTARVPAPSDGRAVREEEDLRGLIEVLEG